MTPSSVIWHDSLPLTRNGKVDRGKLAALPPAAPGEARTAVPAGSAATETENRLIALWASVLKVPAETIGPDSDFYALGGDSLAGARIFTGVRKQFGVSITLDRLYELRVLQVMASTIQVSAGAA